MRLIAFVIVLALGVTSNFRHSQSIRGGTTCDVSPTVVTCQGNYIGSNGCGAFSVSGHATFGTQTKKKSQSQGSANCKDSTDTAGVACATEASVDVLSAAACFSNVPFVPFF
jgi:hypothetical protein